MNDYYSVRLDCEPCSADITDLAAAFLADAGFESFEPDDKGLTAYINVTAGDAEALARNALADFPFDVNFNLSCTLIVGEDWNEEWEKNYFKPIVIDDECVIHSSFHKDVPVARYDIMIDPKMAFGTGHHDTTSNMVRYILECDVTGKSVLDVGTGTGILGILAAMRGAHPVTGIEIDLPAYENAVENVGLNNVSMKLIHGDASALKLVETADYLFANINRNIIIQDMKAYADSLKSDGIMLLSGFYENDIPLILKAAEPFGLGLVSSKVSPANWAAIMLKRSL